MKHFLCATAVMIALAMLFILGPSQSLAANQSRCKPQFQSCCNRPCSAG